MGMLKPTQRPVEDFIPGRYYPAGGPLATLKKRSASWYIENPTVGNEYLVMHTHNDVPITITKIGGEVDPATSVTFQVEQHAKNAAHASGTSIDVLTTPLAFTTTGAESTTFDDATVPGNTWLIFKCTAVSGSPTKAWGYIDYTVDD